VKVRVAIIFLALALGALATTIIPQSVEQLTRQSAAVFEGRALRTWTAYSAQHTQVFTYTQFAVAKALKGQAAQTITIKQPGGIAPDGKIEQKVYGVRYYKPGDSAVVFLQSSADGDGTYWITGLLQGDFRVVGTQRGEQVMSNGISGVQAYDGASHHLVSYQGDRIPLSQLEARVTKEARQ
jgi:hypothetical protein